MSDRELRALERSWRAEPTPETLEALVQAFRQAGQPLPLDAVRSLPRWRSITDLTRTFFGSPLGETGGDPSAAITSAEERLGPLPLALREWYRLAGRRAVPVQCIPVLLDELEYSESEDFDGDALVVYTEWENEWLAGVRRADLPQDDPPVVISHHRFNSWEYSSSTEFLRCILVMETLQGLLLGYGRGPLGGFANTVRGGRQRSVLPPAYPCLVQGAFAPNRCIFPDIHGDSEILLSRDMSSDLVWGTATAAANTRLREHLTLEASPDALLLLRFVDLEEPVGAELNQLYQDPRPIEDVLSEGSRVRSERSSFDPSTKGWTRIELQVETRDPTRELDRIRTVLRPEWVRHLEAGSRPCNMGVWTPLWPEGLTTFVI